MCLIIMEQIHFYYSTVKSSLKWIDQRYGGFTSCKSIKFVLMECDEIKGH